ncbi:class IV adenylate cyclase [Stratiformator vulcanicus]|uniref:CYTH domain protein n=1 Tax=Stratiformator vulcanicus TaxID=2527980 RepID=A0A517R5S8_9PLAN|nr:class IV adenylate cyclase [Stratiformator vulcanicus]QDT39183.1 CYTH domain protein [Stratiformator vulcanicus]
MAYEVESKFPVDSHDTIKAELADLGATAGVSIRQADQYLRHPCRDFASTDEALRIRRVNDSAVLTYKGPRLAGATKARFEAEYSLDADGRSGDGFAEIFTRLGFEPVLIVRKERQPFTLEFEGHHFEIALDRVESLGCYVELELTAEDDSLEAARSAVTALAARLHLGTPEPRSYLEMLLTK